MPHDRQLFHFLARLTGLHTRTATPKRALVRALFSARVSLRQNIAGRFTGDGQSLRTLCPPLTNRTAPLNAQEAFGKRLPSGLLSASSTFTSFASSGVFTTAVQRFVGITNHTSLHG